MRSKSLLMIPFFFLTALCLSIPSHAMELNIPGLENAAKERKDPVVFYDLGVLYSNAGNTGKAVLNFKKTLLLKPSDREAAANLNALRQSIGIPPYFSDSSPIEKAVLFPFLIFPLNAGSIFGLVLFILGSAGLSVNLSGFAKKLKLPGPDMIRTVSIIMAVIGAVYLLSSLVRYNFTFDPRNAVALHDTKLLERPDGDAINLADIPGGMECVVRDGMNGYFRISTLDGREGWIVHTDLERLWEGEK